MVAKLACGVGCLPVAPGFTKAPGGPIARRYTLDRLRARLGL